MATAENNAPAEAHPFLLHIPGSREVTGPGGALWRVSYNGRVQPKVRP